MIILFDYDTQELSRYPDFSKIDKLSFRLGDTVVLDISVVRRRVPIDPPCGEMPVFTLKRNSSDFEYLVLLNEFEKIAKPGVGTIFRGRLKLNSKELFEEITEKNNSKLVGEFALVSEDENQNSSKLLKVEISTDLYKGTEAPPPQVIPQWRDDVETVKQCAKDVIRDKGIVLESTETAKRLAEAAEESNAAANTSNIEAGNSRDKAQKWAEEAVDTPVDGEGEEAEYSSKHWATKSHDEAQNAKTQAESAEKSAEAAEESKNDAEAAMAATKKLKDNAATSAGNAGNAETQTGVNLELSDILAQHASRSAADAAASAGNAGESAEIALAQARQTETLHDQVVVLEQSATEAAQVALDSKTDAGNSATDAHNDLVVAQSLFAQMPIPVETTIEEYHAMPFHEANHLYFCMREVEGKKKIVEAWRGNFRISSPYEFYFEVDSDGVFTLNNPEKIINGTSLLAYSPKYSQQLFAFENCTDATLMFNSCGSEH